MAVARVAEYCPALLLQIVAGLLFIGLLLPGVTAPASAHEGYDGPTFTEAAAATGLLEAGGSSYAWVDFDGDLRLDLVVNGHRLFRSLDSPDVGFAEVEDDGIEGGYGGVWADYDNDGLTDVFVTTAQRDPTDRLYRNLGGGQFEDVTATAGINDEWESPAAGWGDYDGDGYVDLYIANYENPDNMGEPRPDYLWHNNGDGTFTDVSQEAGIRAEPDQCGRGVSWADYDNDGDLDIYVSNYRLDPNYLWENQGDGTFVEVAQERGVAGIRRDDTGGGDAYGHTIGSAWADWDNDGDLDLFIANLVHKDHERGRYCDDSKLYRNDGPAAGWSFTDIRDGSGIPYRPFPGDEDELFSGPAWADYDNDGDLDLFITQVYTNLDYAHSHLYRNLGDGQFENVIVAAGARVWGAWGTAWGDYDADGDLDLVVGGRDGSDSSDYPARLHLFRNDGHANHANHALHLRLSAPPGAELNTAAIGARVTVQTPDGSQLREVAGGTGTSAMYDSPTLEFGLGDHGGPVDVTVRWPDGTVETHQRVAVDRLVGLEPGGEPVTSAWFGTPPSASGDDDEAGAALAVAGAAVALGGVAAALATRQRLGLHRAAALAVGALLIGGAMVGAWAREADDDDDDGEPGPAAADEPEPSPYAAQPDETLAPRDEYGDERSAVNFTYAVSGAHIAGVTFSLDWEDEAEYDGGQYAYRNNGDSFALEIWGPNGSHAQSPYIYNEQEAPGHVALSLAFAWDAPGPPGDYVVTVHTGECGDQRAFGGAYIIEDDGNDYHLEGSTAIWEIP